MDLAALVAEGIEVESTDAAAARHPLRRCPLARDAWRATDPDRTARREPPAQRRGAQRAGRERLGHGRRRGAGRPCSRSRTPARSIDPASSATLTEPFVRGAGGRAARGRRRLGARARDRGVVVRAHGGSLELAARAEGGLVVRVAAARPESRSWGAIWSGLWRSVRREECEPLAVARAGSRHPEAI